MKLLDNEFNHRFYIDDLEIKCLRMLKNTYINDNLPWWRIKIFIVDILLETVI